MKRLIIRPGKCTGCRQCELSCSFLKTGRFRLLDARLGVVVWQEDGFATPVVCQHCEDAECVRICPVRAIRRHPSTGAITIDSQLCVGCRACFTVCPVAGMCLDDKGKPVKCDLCGGDPECVKACVPGALTYDEDSTAVRLIRRSFAIEMAPPRVVAGGKS